MEKFVEIYFNISGAAELFIGYHYFIRMTGKRSRTNPVLSALIIVTVMQLCFGMVSSVTGMISPAMIGGNPDFTAAVMILFNLISLFLSCVCYEFLIKIFSEKLPCITNDIGESGQMSGLFDMKIFFIPLILILCIGVYINHIFFGNTVSANEPERISENSPAIFIFQVLGISSVFCILRTFGEIIKNKTLAEYSELRAESAESRYEKTKSFRHDVKNHMAVLTGLLKQGDITEAEKYLSGMKFISDDFSIRFQTGRAVTDIIINSKLSNAVKMGIDVACEMKIPPCKISDSDLCIIIANAVDNAIHACADYHGKSGNFIRIQGIFQEDIFLIEIKNSFDGKKFNRGIGLKNIRSAAEKYDGSVRTECKENVFNLTVLLNISQH